MSDSLSKVELTALISPRQQALRRAALLRLHRQHCYELYRDDGSFALPGDHNWRLYLWNALSLFDGEPIHIRRANAMLRQVAGQPAGHFWSSAASSIAARFADRLEPDVRDMLWRRLATDTAAEAGQRFRGYNDNYPAMAAVAMLVGAPAVGEHRYRDEGLACLDSARQLLTRRGMLSEYASPTYSPITLTCLAEIVECSPDAAARRLARQLEARVWAEVASRFHPQTSFIAGPHSRAYLADMCAHCHNIHVICYLVFGRRAFVNPLTALFPPIPGQILHGNRAEFTRGHIGWHATATYHLPRHIAALALQKRYPCVVEATSEQAAFPRNFFARERHPKTPLAEFAAAAVHTHTYLDRDFATGVSDRPYLDGYQHTAFHLVYRRRAPARRLQDIGTVFARFLSGQHRPDRSAQLFDEGRTLCLGHGATALVLYHGKPNWGQCSPFPDLETHPVGSLKVSVIVPCFWGQPDEIWLGERRVRPWTGSSEEPVSIFLRDGPLYLAIHPLLLTDYGRPAAVQLEVSDGFGLISLVNYAGKERPFSDVELMTCLNGFVAEASAARHWRSFAAFRAFHRKPRIADVYVPDDGARRTRYEREGLELAMEISPVSDGVRYRAVNGRLVEPQKFAVTGFDNLRLFWLR
jgi:hypothetical protein